MAYKTFTARNGTSGYTDSGKTITLYGGFYGYGVAKSFREKTVLVLTTGDSRDNLMSKFPEYLCQSVSEQEITDIERKLELVKQDPGYTRLEVCLTGKGKKNQLAYTSVDYV